MCLKFRFNAEKCFLWGCFSVFVLVVILIACIVFYIIAGYVAYRPYHKYSEAMKSGDGTAAVTA